MSVFTDIANGIKGVISAADKLFTSDDERNEYKRKVKEIKADVDAKLIALEADYLKVRSDLIRAEIQGQSWLGKNWRPLLMLIAMFILFNNYILLPYAGMFGYTVPSLELTDGLWNLLTVSVGGYVVGRSFEKVKTNGK